MYDIRNLQIFFGLSFIGIGKILQNRELIKLIGNFLNIDVFFVYVECRKIADILDPPCILHQSKFSFIPTLHCTLIRITKIPLKKISDICVII